MTTDQSIRREIAKANLSHARALLIVAAFLSVVCAVLAAVATSQNSRINALETNTNEQWAAQQRLYREIVRCNFRYHLTWDVAICVRDSA